MCSYRVGAGSLPGGFAVCAIDGRWAPGKRGAAGETSGSLLCAPPVSAGRETGSWLSPAVSGDIDDGRCFGGWPLSVR